MFSLTPRRARPRRLLAPALAVALVLLGSAASASAADRYVALGDSYSSGTGTRVYTNTACQRSSTAYPSLVGAQRPNTTLVFVACSGATTADVINNQVSSLTAGTEIVTITIGGNDAGFGSVILECAKPGWLSNCAGKVTTAQNFIQNTLPGRLNAVFDEIQTRSPTATVVVLDYPRLFNGEDCNAATFFSPDDETRLNATANLLRTTLQARATAYGFSFGDVIPAFVGHAVCDAPEWINGLSNPTGESYHPNTTGHSSGYAPVVRAITG